MKFVLLLLFFWYTQSIVGQEPHTINWASENLAKPNINEIIPLDKNRFYVHYFGGTSLLPVSKIALYQYGEELVSKKIDQQIGGSFVTLEQFFVFRGVLYGCFSRRQNNNYQIFIQKYTLEADPVEEPILACEYTIPKGKNKDRIITVHKSPNERCLAIEYIVTGKQENFDIVGYVIFNERLEKIQLYDIEIPYESNRTSIELRSITDEGRYFVGVNVFNKTTNGAWKDYRTVEKTVIYASAEDSIVEYEMPIIDKRIFNFGVVSKDSLAVVTGTWGNETDAGALGLFYARIDLQKRTIGPVKFEVFSPEMLIQSQFEADPNNNVNTREAQQTLVNYAFRNLILRPDGSLIVLAEQYYIYEYNTTDSRGMSNYVNYYYYNDCLVYSISDSARLNWFVRIPKQQESMNDYGFFSSILSFTSAGKMVLLFNDDNRNYNLMHQYKGHEASYSSSTRNKNYCLAEVTIQLDTGVTERHILNEYDLTKGNVVLKLSEVDQKNNQVILYSQGKNDKYGLLHF